MMYSGCSQGSYSRKRLEGREADECAFAGGRIFRVEEILK